METGLFRQRRNLVLISSILIVGLLTGAEADKISILGTSITLKTEVLPVIAWVIWGYFLWRYHSFLAESEVKLLRPLVEARDRAVFIFAERFWFKGQVFENPYYYLKWKCSAKAFICHQGQTNHDGKRLQQDLETTPRWMMLPLGLCILWIFLFQRTHVTEYIAPYFLALTALVLGLRGQFC